MVDEDDEDESEEDEEEIADEDGDDDGDTAACPECGKMIYDDAQRCPHCGNYISPEAPGRKPLWFVVVAIVCVLLIWFFCVKW